MPQPPLDLRPLELGELVDRTIVFWRAHWKPLFALGLGFQLVVYAFTKVILLEGPRLTAITNELKDGNLDHLASIAGLTGSIFVLSLISMWIYWAGTVAASAYVVPRLLGREASPKAAVRKMFARFGAITSSGVLYGLLLFGIIVALTIPIGISFGVASQFGGVGIAVAALFSIVWFLVNLAAFLWIWVRLVAVAPVLAVEELGGYRSLVRSSRLVSGRVAPGFLGRVFIRAGIIFLIAFLVLLAVKLVFGMPSMIVGGIYATFHNSIASAPQVLLVPGELLQVVGEGLFQPIAWVLTAVFYLDLRVRKEGLDLELQLAPEQA